VYQKKFNDAVRCVAKTLCIKLICHFFHYCAETQERQMKAMGFSVEIDQLHCSRAKMHPQA